MDINNQQIKQPIIRCFVEISGMVGHIKYVSIQQNHLNDVLEFSEESIRKEIFFDEGFMEKTFTPVYCYLRDHFSNSDAVLMVRSLIETGIEELKRRYSSYLYHQENDLMNRFHPTISVGDTKIMPYLTEVYEQLKTHFPEDMVDDFCINLVLYGMTVVKELPDTQIFGSHGYQRTTN